MDGWILSLFVLAAFAGGFVSGFSGFAMGLVVSGVWLHIITPIQTAALIAGYGHVSDGGGLSDACRPVVTMEQRLSPIGQSHTRGILAGVADTRASS
jgi:hypothetical protein